jgi:ABC-type Na+ transport system ATPase subunit NatA
VEKLADNIGIIRKGHLVEQGNLKEITAHSDESLEDLFLSKYEDTK